MDSLSEFYNEFNSKLFYKINFNLMLSKVIEVLTFGKFYLGNKKDILYLMLNHQLFLKIFLKFVNTIFLLRNEKIEIYIFQNNCREWI